MDLALTIAQTNPTLGDVHENLGEHLRVATAAADEGADLVLFPELSLTGYFLRDQVFDLAVAPDDALLDPLRDLSRRVTLVIGLAERAPDGRCFNSQVVLEDGAVLAVHRKVHLVSYGMFDEGRDFAAGEAWDTVTSKHGRFGLFLCEDLWHLGGQYLRLLDRVDAFLVGSAGPGRGVSPRSTDGDAAPRFESVDTWHTLLGAAAMHAQCYVAWANRVGFEDGIAFGGSSAVLGPEGRELAACPGLDEGTATAHLTSAALFRARQRTPLLRDSRPELVRRALADPAPDDDAGTEVGDPDRR